MAVSDVAIDQSTENEVVVSRIINAPRSLVFKAWSDREHLMKWFAPATFTLPSCSVDFRVGGKFHYCMRTPDGSEVWGLGIYKEIMEPSLIVYSDSFADAGGNAVSPTHYGCSESYPFETLISIIFEEYNGKTRIILRHAVKQGVKEREGIFQGWSEMLQRLDEHASSTERKS